MKKNTILFLLLLMFIPIASHAQMFSVGESEDRQPTRIQSYSTFGAGIEFADFNFTGSNVPLADQAAFDGSIFRIRFENPGLDISAGFGGSLTGIDDYSYANVSALLYNDFPLIRSQQFILALPLQIGTDLMSVQIDRSSNNFQQSSFTIGTGASLRYQINPRVGVSLRATPNIGFSFSQGNLFGGRLFRGTTAARFYFNEVFGSAALVVGYDFDYRDYNIEGTQNDYEFLSHAITVGLAF
ncbi:hypothetical protein [Rhodohalobacter sp. 8-1]|uniref:hypothetical protein n=1 Tax=Rhodohalobacter sp. 8-1 TaxID=3131972 RepID=UPI0030EEF87C